MLVLHDLWIASALPFSAASAGAVYNRRVRRLWAALLLLVFSVPLITPLLARQPERKLPPCCRRDGKHGCAMMARALGYAEALPGTAGMRGTKTPCPLYPSGKTAPAGMAGLALPTLHVVPGGVVLAAAVAEPAVAPPSAPEFPATPTRGPPAARTLL